MKEITMWEVSKSDWKLFREKIAGWQEHYMEKLAQDYTALLTDESKPASAKFWELEKRIKADKKRPGVLIRLDKAEVKRDIVLLLRDGAITMDDLQDFSDDLKETVAYIVEKW